MTENLVMMRQLSTHNRLKSAVEKKGTVMWTKLNVVTENAEKAKERSAKDSIPPPLI